VFESSGSPTTYSVGNITLVEDSTNMVIILDLCFVLGTCMARLRCCRNV